MAQQFFWFGDRPRGEEASGRFVRLRKELFGPGRGISEARHGFSLLIGLVFDAANQMVGFAAGPGDARERLASFEMDRMELLNRRNHAIFAQRN